MANVLASPSALQEIGSFDLIASPRPSPPPWDARRIIIQFAYLRQSLPAAGIIEESESARGERGRVGQGRVGFRV